MEARLIFLVWSSLLFCDSSAAIKPISDLCFQCMCEAFSGCEFEGKCKITSRGNEDVCGPFQMSRDYWTDTGLDINNSEFGAYTDCAKDLECSQKVIQRHVSRNLKDCDGNGRIDCLDVGLANFFGESCTNARLRTAAPHWISFRACNSIMRPPDRFEMPRKPVSKGPKVEEKCMSCLCNVLTGCNKNNRCQPNEHVGRICGPFNISPPMWRDTLNDGDSRDDKAFERCAFDFDCSKRSVLTYIERFHNHCTVKTTSNPCEQLYRTFVMGPGPCAQKDIAMKEMLWDKIVDCYNS